MNLSEKMVESTKKVAYKSKYVKINYENIYKSLPLFEKTKSSNYLVKEYLDLNKLTNEEITRFFLVLEAIDFCFWGKPKWTITYKEKEFDGYYGMVIALIRALDEGYNILDFEYLKNISIEDFSHILRGTTIIPLFNERLDIVRNIVRVSLDKFDGKVYDNFYIANSDEELLSIIVENYSDYYDVSYYENSEVYFYKKATLLVHDLYSYIPQIKEKIKNVDNLLAGADYKLPQVLRELNILEYCAELEEIVDNKKEIEHDLQMEIEIRANTIYAIDIIKKHLKEKSANFSSFELGTAIWLLSKNEKYKNKPHHLCYTIFY